MLFGILVMLQTISARAQTAEEKKLEALADIRRELACYCGCSLTVEDCQRSMRCSESAKLSQEVKSLYAAGKTKTEILQAMVAQYSETILSSPTKKGFNLAAWILPFAAIGIGGIAAAMVIKKWRSQTRPLATAAAEAAATTSASTNDPYASQVEEELKKLER